MEREAIESFDHKGLKINIYQDEYYEGSPDKSGDDSLFLTAFHSDFTVNRDGFEKEVCQYLAGNTDQDDDVIARAKEVKKQYHTFGLEAYIHSGVVLALSYEGNFCDRQWDVSQLGLVFVSKKETKSKVKARKLALGLIQEWNYNLSGEVYGFVITKEEECVTCEHVNVIIVDSCWGFIGDMEGCKMEAITCANDALAPKPPPNQSSLPL